MNVYSAPHQSQRNLAAAPRVCAHCGQQYQPLFARPFEQVYCSAQCRIKANTLRAKARKVKIPEATECLVCKKPMPPREWRGVPRKYCSLKCGRRAINARRTAERRAQMNLSPRPCKVCNRVFDPQWKHQVLCDASCRGANAHMMSYEHNRKHYIPAALRPMRQCEWCGDDYKPQYRVTRYCKSACRKEDTAYRHAEDEG